MIFDAQGLPRDNGATDWLDSSRLAGLMVTLGYPRAINVWAYIDEYGMLIRYPGDEEPFNFSRDQMVCLIAGMWTKRFQSTNEYVLNTLDHQFWFAPNGDFNSPSVRNHVALCACDDRPGALKTSKLGYSWFKWDILWNAYMDPLSEPNQLICMLWVAGPEYIRMWKRHNTQWREAILVYWGGWRGELEFAGWMIQVLEAV